MRQKLALTLSIFVGVVSGAAMLWFIGTFNDDTDAYGMGGVICGGVIGVALYSRLVDGKPRRKAQ